MKLVENENDIINNIVTFDKYRISKKPTEKTFYKNSVKRGKCFLTYSVDGNWYFAPSRFIGYAENSEASHLQNKDKDGRETNPKLEKIFRAKFLEKKQMETLYEQRCYLLDLEVGKKKRKYIVSNIVLS